MSRLSRLFARIHWGHPLALVPLILILVTSPTGAEYVVEIPVLAAFRANDRGVFEMMLIHWDQKPSPNPVALRWMQGGVTLGEGNLDSLVVAFRYAVERTPSVPHTGTVSVQGVTYLPTTSDGPSAGAVMAVGLIAMFKGESVRRGVALTGTIEPDGTIGPVGAIPDKVRAAAREGCRTILIPAGQLQSSQWNLVHLGFQLNVEIKEMATIDDAYELMTGRKI